MPAHSCGFLVAILFAMFVKWHVTKWCSAVSGFALFEAQGLSLGLCLLLERIINQILKRTLSLSLSLYRFVIFGLQGRDGLRGLGQH